MSLKESPAFVLKTYDYRDRDEIAVYFTDREGKVRVLVKRAKGEKSKYGSSLETMTKVNLHYFQSKKRNLARMNECNILFSPLTQSTGMETGFWLSYIAELLDGFSQEGLRNGDLFRLTEKITESIMETDNKSLLILYFEIWLLKLEGVLPNYSVCHGCGEQPRSGFKFVLEKRDFLCKNCAPDSGGYLFGKMCLRLVERALGNKPGKFAKMDISNSTIKYLRKILTLMIADIMGWKPKSLKIIQQMNGESG